MCVLKAGRHKIIRIGWFLMALNIFNLSADSPDGGRPNAPEDLSVNDMESITEIIFEQFLGYDNAFAESDEQNEPEGQSLDFKKVSLYFHIVEHELLAASQAQFIIPSYTYVMPAFPVCYSEVLNPPPEA